MRHKFIDSITRLTHSGATACKHLSPQDEVFEDHFPGYPVLPAAMMVEMSSRLAEKWVIWASSLSFIFVPFSFNKFKFYSHAKPGDTIELELSINPFSTLIGGLELSCMVKAVNGNDKLFEGHFVGKIFPLSDFMSSSHAEQDLNTLGVKIV